MISVSETPPLSKSYCVLLPTGQPQQFSALISHWWSFHTVSLLREALFPIITGPVISARTYVLPPALWLSGKFDGGIKHMWVKGNMAVPSYPSVYQRGVRGLMSPWEGTECVGLGGFLPVFVCLSVSLDMFWKVTITGWRVEFSGHAALQISPAILHCSNRFHVGLCLVLSSGWHSDLINIHACQMN